MGLLFFASIAWSITLTKIVPSVALAAKAEPASQDKSGLALIRAGRLIDVKNGRVLTEQGILIEGERIKQVGPVSQVEAAAAGALVIDLSRATVMPGLIDCHTHILLQGDVTAADYDEQLLKDSIPFRAIRATAAVKAGLMNGFTAMRDLETEGAMYADVDVKRAINLGYIEGPHLFVSTRALSTTGTYPLIGYSWELKVPEGVQIVDGVDEIRKAVRQQVKYGADWIKYYSDRRYYLKDGALHSWVNFTDEEAKAIVDETHRLGKKVAAHAIGRDGIASALRAGVDSIEHGDGLDDELIEEIVRRGIRWCPTIYVGVYVAEGRAAAGAPIWRTMIDLEARAFNKAVKKGVKIVFGTDAGGFPWTENEAKEFNYMVKYGMTPMQAIQAATAEPAAMLDASQEIGSIEPGRYADIIAVAGDPLADISLLEHVSFVMKSGKVVRK
jgi:imidazolonepropionase-like amidohydrolase